ncbi:MAG: protein-glutamine gamma-glutamyltransferase [Oscillospiraceae bacterium]|jgi:protein-glutamine gamma-glutamyltransferase|nr:protein-glutamine gamma-glutamyltransferase [Oscillospiraceae bacterium]
MITIHGNTADYEPLARELTGSVERETLSRLWKSPSVYDYGSAGQLKFELELRREIVNAAYRLLRGGLRFETFRNTYCNERFWQRRADGGFELRRGVSAAEAVSDMFENGRLYGTECATAMQIVYYGALAKVFPRDLFDREFAGAYLMNWHKIDRDLRETGLMRASGDYLPGDRRYFINPDVNPETPEWQGENVIDLGDGTYYGHGIGRTRGSDIIAELDRYRRNGARRGAYLLDSAGRPDFERLFDIYERGGTRASA